jgi:hypothetical protein
MAGVIHIGGTQSPFFILSVASYSDTFAGMLAWEPLMPLYLTELFPPYPIPQTPVATVSTTTVSTSSPQATTEKRASTKTATTSTSSLQVVTPPALAPVVRFFDTTIANHDARVYRDSARRIILVYGYWNNTTLIIARDDAAFTELITRLATARTP